MSSASIQIASRQHRLRWWHYALLAAIVLLAFAPCDLPVARWCYQHEPSRRVLKTIERFADLIGTGLGAALLLAAAMIFSRSKMSRVPRLVAITLGGGLLADIVKISIWRVRPHSTDLSVATFESTFHGLFPFLSVGSKGQSFPSGHAATAIGLAVALSILYPRGRWYFVALAVAVAACRVILHAHYLTDVLAGLMLGGASAIAGQRGYTAPVFAWCEQKIDGSIVGRRNRLRGTANASCKLAVPSPPVALNSKSDKCTVV
jgi:membrane-associated phospholipid phosphatase